MGRKKLKDSQTPLPEITKEVGTMNRSKRKILLQESKTRSSGHATSSNHQYRRTPLADITKGDLNFNKHPTTNLASTDSINVFSFTPLITSKRPAGFGTHPRPTKKPTYQTASDSSSSPLTLASISKGSNVTNQAVKKISNNNYKKKQKHTPYSILSSKEFDCLTGPIKTNYKHTKFKQPEIPRIEICQTTREIFSDAYSRRHGISTDYIDHGDVIYKCGKCNAMLWEAEMLRGNHDLMKDSFGFCCGSGKVQLPPTPTPPPLLKKLYKEDNPQSTNFMNNIRAYNMMFAFTSMGGKLDKAVMSGKGPFVFRLQGQNFHRMGSLLPEEGQQPKFSQLYIYDSENEAANM